MERTEKCAPVNPVLFPVSPEPSSSLQLVQQGCSQARQMEVLLGMHRDLSDDDRHPDSHHFSRDPSQVRLVAVRCCRCHTWIVRVHLIMEEGEGAQTQNDQVLPRTRPRLRDSGGLHHPHKSVPQDTDILPPLPPCGPFRFAEGRSNGEEMQKMFMEGQLEQMPGIRGAELQPRKGRSDVAEMNRAPERSYL